MSKRIAILGSKGMLGQTVSKYFSPNNDVIKFDERYSTNNRYDFISQLKSIRPDVIINCIGKIKQKSSRYQDLLTSNALLPLDLNNFLSDATIIHPSTDCVFSGKNNKPYNVFDFPDASDDYGLSKLYGEFSGQMRDKTFIIRTSIIGLTKNYDSEGLLDWFMRQSEDTPINGYTNHMWNGITTLDWCIFAEQIILDRLVRKNGGIIQIGTSKAISKYELLILANKIFGCNISIKPKNTKESIARVLESEFKLADIHDQLNRYWQWVHK